MSHHAPPETWVEWIEAPGAAHVGACRKILTGLDQWWNLQPDQSAFVTGEGKGLELNVAARCPAKGWFLVYFATGAPATIRVDRVGHGGSLKGSWIDPRSGLRESVGTVSGRVQAFTPPTAWEDALLLLEA
jgi:hypothetical protein